MPNQVRNLTKDEFSREVLESSTPVLVDFWADWCAPCRRVAPIVEQVADHFEGRLSVVKVDVDAEPELARSHDIQSIPALLFFVDGEVVDRISGVVPFGELADHAGRVIGDA